MIEIAQPMQNAQDNFQHTEVSLRSKYFLLHTTL